MMLKCSHTRAVGFQRPKLMGLATTPNNSVERDRPQAALVGSLRGFAATAAPHVKRWAPSFIAYGKASI